MSVRQLIEVPTLRTRLLAGTTGLDTEVLWAHSCELERPWEWLGRGDLLMTTGRNFPADGEAQVDFVRTLASVGVSGLAVAAGMNCPALRSEASVLADELAFPILETAYEVPFVALSRVVAAAGQGESQARLNRVLRVYDAYRTAVQTGMRGEALLRHIGVELGLALAVVDTRYGRAVLDGGARLSTKALTRITEHADLVGALPAVTRLNAGSEELLLLPIASHPGWATVADVSGSKFDVLLLQHVNTILTIEAERLRADSETRLAVSGRLMSHLIEGNVDSELVKDRLADFELASGPWRVLTATSSPFTRPVEVQAALDDAGVHHLVHLQASTLVVLTDDVAGAAAAIDAALGSDAQIGVSNEVTRVRSVADAVRQADWAREACRVDGRRIAYYGQDRPLFLPPSVVEAETVVRTVLGALIDYDARHGTDLIDSLTVFFEANRSWQVASKHLQVHKQTLVYRMKRISEITGRRLDDLDDITELHLALRAKALLDRT